MSESSLWDRIRNNVGHMGHLTRLEFNPEDGIPDVDFCFRGVEGKLELKHRHDEPVRATTPVFKHHGIRDSQLAWIFTRVRHGGRVGILAQVDRTMYLVPGRYVRVFNKYTLAELQRVAIWTARDGLGREGWLALVAALVGRDLSNAGTRQLPR